MEEKDCIVQAFEQTLEIKIGEIPNLVSLSTLNSILRKVDLAHFSMTQVSELKDFLEGLLQYAQQNGLDHSLTIYEQQTLVKEVNRLRQTQPVSWAKAPNLKNFLVTVIAVIFLFNWRVQEEVLLDGEVQDKVEKKLRMLRGKYNVEKRLQIKSKMFGRFKKLKDFEIKSMKEELKEMGEKVDRLRKEGKQKERALLDLQKESRRLSRENQNLTEMIFQREGARIGEKEALQESQKKLDEQKQKLGQLMGKYRLLQKKNSHLEVVLKRVKKRDLDTQKLKLKVVELEEQMSEKEEFLSQSQRVRDAEQKQWGEERAQMQGAAQEMDFRFEKLKRGMDYYRTSYRDLLAKTIKEQAKKDYDSQPTSKINNQYFEIKKEDVQMYSSAVPLDADSPSPNLNFSFENLTPNKQESPKANESKKSENVFEKSSDEENADFINQKKSALRKKLPESKDEKSEKEADGPEKEEEKLKLNEFDLPDLDHLGSKEDQREGEDDMNWGIEKEGDFLNLSGSFDMHQESFGFSQKLEDILEESNESECQSGYSSTRQVHYFFYSSFFCVSISCQIAFVLLLFFHSARKVLFCLIRRFCSLICKTKKTLTFNFWRKPGET